MERGKQDDPDSILSSDHLEELKETLILRSRGVSASTIESTLTHYADSMELLISTNSLVPADPYTRGFVAGIRAAAKVAANAINASDTPG